MKLESLKSGKLSGGAIVASALESVGITHTFGIPGTHNIELYDALEDSPIQAVLVTDEQCASFMADGLTRSGGALGCVNVVPGAGLTHSLSGIAEAYMDNIPMLVLLCGIRQDISYSYQLHDIDQLAIVKPVVKKVFSPNCPHEVATMIIEAAHLALSGCPGPVAIEIPAEFYLKKQSFDQEEFSRWLKIFREETSQIAQIDSDLLSKAIDMIKGWKKPLIHVGMGAKEAHELLIPLATKMGAIVSSTFSGKGVFPESHPHWLWPGFGNACPAPLKKLSDQCDGILIIGARMGEVSTASFGVTLPEQSIQVDIEGEVPGINFPVDLKIKADAKIFIEQLLTKLDNLPLTSDSIKSELESAHQQVLKLQGQKSEKNKVSPFHLFKEIQLHLPPSTSYVTDSGNGTFLAMEHLQLDKPSRFLAPSDFSCMGYCVPSAIGAALAHPDKLVVAFPGDGALLMTGLELITASYHQLPILFFVLRDGELGQIASFQKTTTNRTPGSILPPFSLKALAEVAHLNYLKMENDASIQNTISSAYNMLLEKKGPVVIEVNIDYSQKTFFTKGVVKSNLFRLSWTDRYHMISRAIGRRLVKK